MEDIIKICEMANELKIFALNKSKEILHEKTYESVEVRFSGRTIQIITEFWTMYVDKNPAILFLDSTKVYHFFDFEKLKELNDEILTFKDKSKP